MALKYFILRVKITPPSVLTCSRRFSSAGSVPWLEKGLYFSCTQCGKCCKGQTNVYLNSSEIEALASHLNIEEEEFLDKYTESRLVDRGIQTSLLSFLHPVTKEKQCIFLEGKKCSGKKKSLFIYLRFCRFLHIGRMLPCAVISV